ncbi:branched-chain amino acid ABC transporter permease [Pararoseomonas indoligenes]|uniref:Branched-chain amino acid ABC transporter permease n=1 Tax=Roseomonas indoligenes TaxID=2820811 RepID=A0A940MZQ7_9PROT|nr:branched-chain amino acid ABC transporter permease [Pararoseomonas indoligenes]MBP0492650.1 branched-chain amino acid ABC transporter permease [Pararoseomonas indoligenes]
MTAAPEETARRQLAGLARWRPAEIAFWVLVLAAYFLFPQRAALIAEVAVIALFALSLDLVLGYAGILTLGHAAFFGWGAYAAGIAAARGWEDPVLGLLLGGGTAGVLGLLGAPLVLRGGDLTRLMVTLGLATVLHELANRFTGLTGGADGLQGMNVGPLLGKFEFDLEGHVGAAYALAVLFLAFLLLRRIALSPFGWSLRAIRANPLRAAALGIPVRRRLVAAYTIGAALAGVAGALLAQVTQFVSLDVLSFQRSADGLLVLLIGGVGWLYGGLVGAVVFKLMQDLLSSLTPQYWQFWIGALLVALVLLGRDRPRAWIAGLRRPAERAAP